MKSSLAFSLASAATIAHGFVQGDADAMFNSFNHVFLHRANGQAYYQNSIQDTSADSSWSGALDLMIAQDVYRRTGSSDAQSLVSDLANWWLANNSPPWDWNGWNDDIAWYTLGLIRAYQITGNFTLIQPAMNGSDYVFSRGWDTTYNGGGIWELQPDHITSSDASKHKETLSNAPNAHVACLIYTSAQLSTYINRCKTIYDWTRAKLFDSTTGLVRTGIQPDGTLNNGIAAYNQGSFLDLANLLWLITGNRTYYNDAQLALDFGFNQIANSNGVFTNNASYLHTWADEFARGAGNFVHDNNLWSKYYSKFVANANGILSSRRTDLNLTWNAWDQQTPSSDAIVNTFISAVSWLQYTPVKDPSVASNNIVTGIRTIVNVDNTFLMDGSPGYNKAPIAATANSAQSQRWLFSRNDQDNTYNIINLNNWLALGVSDSATNDVVMLRPARATNQRWFLWPLGDGSYSLTNKATVLSLDGNWTKGGQVVQDQYNAASTQKWLLKTL